VSGRTTWPRGAVVTGLAAVAAVLAVQELLRPAWTQHAGPPEQLRDVLEGFDADLLDAAPDLTDRHLAVH
jgi:hypothetical protein